MNAIDKVIIHCSGSPQGRGDTAATIHKWHLGHQWAGIGYHYVILEGGFVEHGRPEYWMGSHCLGYNANSVGICLIGMGGDMTWEQETALKRLIFDVLERHPGATVHGHREFNPNKTCPGFDVGEWWAN